MEPKLILIVGTYALYNDPDTNDTEWLLTAGVDMDSATAKMLFRKHLKENVHQDIELRDITIDSVWFNAYTEVDNFNITLTEKES